MYNTMIYMTIYMQLSHKTRVLHVLNYFSIKSLHSSLTLLKSNFIQFFYRCLCFGFVVLVSLFLLEQLRAYFLQ